MSQYWFRRLTNVGPIIRTVKFLGAVGLRFAKSPSGCITAVVIIGVMIVVVSRGFTTLRVSLLTLLVGLIAFCGGVLSAYYVHRQYESASPWTLENALYEWEIHDSTGRSATVRKITSGICRGD